MSIFEPQSRMAQVASNKDPSPIDRFCKINQKTKIIVNRNQKLQQPLDHIRSSITPNRYRKEEVREKTPSTLSKEQLNKKLLSDIGKYQKQVAYLKKQNQYLKNKYLESDRSYNQLKRIHLQVRKRYQSCRSYFDKIQLSHMNSSKLYNQTQNELIQNTIADDCNLAIRKTLENNFEENFEKMRDRNIELEFIISQLKDQIFKISKGTMKQSESCKSNFDSNHQETQTDGFQCLQKEFSHQYKGQKQLIRSQKLENKVKKYQIYKMQLQKKHMKLKDRCNNIRNLISNESFSN